jgi:integrase/recombinase XerD
MKLRRAVDTYIQRKQSLGMSMEGQSSILGYLCKLVGDVDITSVSRETMRKFFGGKETPGRWHTYYLTIKAFYRFAQARGWVKKTPLPAKTPKFPPSHPPYIYSLSELRALTSAAKALSTAYTPLRPRTYSVLLLLLYGSAIRIGEALSLCLCDVDLVNRVLTIRETKFYKSRLVPIGHKLARALADYCKERRRLPLPQGESSSLFCTRSGRQVYYTVAAKQFRQLRVAAGIHTRGGPRAQPSLHDIRHTSATHHLITWYREGKDVQRMLPYLSTYLGHVSIESTQLYLSLTPELLEQASNRFHRILEPESKHA